MVLLAVAKENNLDIEFVDTNPDFELTSQYLKLNPLKRIPTFEASDGWVLTEVIAIAIHFAIQDENTLLLGRTKREYVEIIRGMSFINSEVQPSLANWFKPLVGRRMYDQKNVETAKKTTNTAIAILEAHLLTTGNTYILGHEVTLADLFAVSSLSRGFQYVFDTNWQRTFPTVTKWFLNVIHLPIWKAIVPEPTIVTEAVSKKEVGNETLEVTQNLFTNSSTATQENMGTFNIQAKFVQKCYSLLTQAKIIDPSLLKLLKVLRAKLREAIGTIEVRENPKKENPKKENPKKEKRRQELSDEDDPPAKRRPVDEEDLIESSYKEAENAIRNLN